MSINSPKVLLIFHLQTAIDMITVSSIAKSMTVEQTSPLLTTSNALPLCKILHISHGNGSLKFWRKLPVKLGVVHLNFGKFSCSDSISGSGIQILNTRLKKFEKLHVKQTYPIVTSKRLLPTELDTAMSPYPLRATRTLVIRSGILVPAASTVSPMISSSISMVTDISFAHQTMKYENTTIHRIDTKNVQGYLRRLLWKKNMVRL